MHTRDCPKCGAEIRYKREDNYLAAVRDNNWCKLCSLAPASRNCPSCGDCITYVNRTNCIKADRKNQICLRCDAERRRTKYSGAGNPFYGKCHSDETKKKIASQDQNFKHSDWFKKRRSETSKRGEENPMYGRSVYEFWLKKYGKDEADHKMDETKRKWSAAFSGENNPMFGKPSPQGSGCGWKGWYKGWFFRSLRELAYRIKVIEYESHEWQSAESKELSIPYVDPNGAMRTYRADFLIDKKILVEVKPDKLRSSRIVRAKEVAAVKFCEARGWEYQIVDPPKLTNEEIRFLHDSGRIRFTDRYEELYQGRFGHEHPGINRDDC